ncbi:hypothetical protein BH20ACT2_BH20ACT2_23840 [soil metagenome]
MEDDAARGGEEAAPGAGRSRLVTATVPTPDAGIRFSGSHKRSIDDKGRLVLPPAIRDELRGGAFLRPMEAGVALWPPEVLAQMRQTLLEQGRRGNLGARNALRALTANATRVVPDSQGRIPFPGELRARAGVDAEVVVVGAGPYVELWAPDRWTPINDDGEAGLVDSWITYEF